jgi:hypothetical protein
MTGSRPALGLAAASVTLCLVIVLELFGSRPAALASQNEVSVARPVRDLAPDLSATPNRHAAMLHDVLARPLFNPGRRPIETDVLGARGLPRLTGIVVAGSQQVAIFAARSNEQPIVVEAGGRVGAYEVRSIADAGVTVVGPEGVTLITPIFDVLHPTASAPPVASAQPSRPVPPTGNVP